MNLHVHYLNIKIMTVNISPYYGVRHQQSDSVDRITSQWKSVCPDVDVSPIEVIGAFRLSRRSIDDWPRTSPSSTWRTWMYVRLWPRCGVRASRTEHGRRSDAAPMVRRCRPNRSIARPPQGRRSGHRAHGNRTEILGSLSQRQQHDVATVLRTMLLALGDHPPEERTHDEVRPVWAPQRKQCRFSHARGRARRAEAAGFESLWIGDHIALPADAPDAADEPRLELVAVLAHLAALTSRVRLATGVAILPLVSRCFWPSSWRRSMSSRMDG